MMATRRGATTIRTGALAVAMVACMTVFAAGCFRIEDSCSGIATCSEAGAASASDAGAAGDASAFDATQVTDSQEADAARAPDAASGCDGGSCTPEGQADSAAGVGAVDGHPATGGTSPEGSDALIDAAVLSADAQMDVVAADSVISILDSSGDGGDAGIGVLDASDVQCTGLGCPCGNEMHFCGAAGSCVANDVNACGAGCAQCAAPRNGNGSASCDGQRCALVCNSGYVPCGDGCCAHRVLAVGNAHSCAIGALGGLSCWGSNNDGQLGNGMTVDSAVPVPVTGLGSGTVAIAAGQSHTCAITVTGSVVCWGDNSLGQLGDNQAESASNVPVGVAGLSSGVVAIAASSRATCAISTSAGVVCWGYGEAGELGVGTETMSPVPVNPIGLGSGVVALTGGFDHYCAMTSASGLMCWGTNLHGEFGNGMQAESDSPVAGGFGTAVTVSAGYSHTCALTAAGAVQCAGDNGAGELGNGGAIAMSTTPVGVTTLTSGVLGLGTGPMAFHECAWTDFAVWCWGNNSNGQTGYTTNGGTITKLPTPSSVPVLTTGVTALSVGGAHTCAVANNHVFCWGGNSNGQLGNGSSAVDGSADTSVPVSVVGL